MIDRRTVFILGAGASKPYGFPTGIELNTDIIENYWNNVQNMLAKGGDWAAMLPDKSAVDEFTERLDGHADSIDLLLRLNLKDDQFLRQGKIAIVSSIINAEKGSRFGSQMNPANRTKDWFQAFSKRWLESIKDAGDTTPLFDKIGFITFNYDRSLEYQMHRIFDSRFIDNDRNTRIAELQNYENIYHIHGNIAGLPWQKTFGIPVQSYPIGEFYLSFVFEAIKGIRIIGESEDKTVIERAQDLLSSAQRIFFLGFGYAQDNLNILNIPKCLQTGAEIFGTLGTEMNKRRIDQIKNEFAPFSQKSRGFHLEQLDSKALLERYL